MAHGGKRKGAGKKKGSKASHTLEAQEVKKRFIERVQKHADELFNSQFALAKGVVHLFRIDEVQEGKKTRREHVLVTDPEEIKKVLDEVDGDGVVDDHYYYISAKDPDNKAVDSMLDRTFGKATQTIDVGNKDDKPFKTTETNIKKLANE